MLITALKVGEAFTLIRRRCLCVSTFQCIWYSSVCGHTDYLNPRILQVFLLGNWWAINFYKPSLVWKLPDCKLNCREEWWKGGQSSMMCDLCLHEMASVVSASAPKGHIYAQLTKASTGRFMTGARRSEVMLLYSDNACVGTRCQQTLTTGCHTNGFFLVL